MGDTAWLSGALDAAYSSAESLGLLSQVIHEPWIAGNDTDAVNPYGTAVARLALIQEGAMHVERPDGQVVTTKARVSFKGPVEPNGAEGRQEPIDPRDRITLPSGLVCSIVEVPGVLTNSETGQPYLRLIWLA